VGEPLQVKRTILEGHRTPLDAFAVAVSVTISLMFVTVLLASGMLALEREEHAFGRLVRGLVSRLGLLGEKLALAAGCAFVASLAMLCGIGIFVDLHWGRFGLWVVALVGGAIGFGARGVAAGLPARAADRLPRARAGGLGGAVALRRDTRDLGAVPVPCGVAGGRQRRQRRLARARRDARPPRGPGGRLPGARARGARPLRMSASRLRLEEPPTAIRPTAPDDAKTQLALRVANRDHTGPWDPVRDETFYTEAGQRLELDLDQRAWSAGSAYAFAVLDMDAGDRLIGRVALSNVVRGPWQNATLGYWIDHRAGGRGHASRAVRLVLQYAFEHAGLHRVQPAIIPRNAASLRVAEKVGFRHEGRAERYLKINGVWEDHEIFALTVEDWRRMRAR
jgi:[ribosomal protein S5]-alanine N-acetyltransferase